MPIRPYAKAGNNLGLVNLFCFYFIYDFLFSRGFCGEMRPFDGKLYKVTWVTNFCSCSCSCVNSCLLCCPCSWSTLTPVLSPASVSPDYFCRNHFVHSGHWVLVGEKSFQSIAIFFYWFSVMATSVLFFSYTMGSMKSLKLWQHANIFLLYN